MGAEGIAALFLPSSESYRMRIDRQKREQRREAVRDHLVELIRAHDPAPHGPSWDVALADYKARYLQMRERLDALRKVAANDRSTLSTTDIEKLDDTTNDFLRLTYARIVLQDRLRAGASGDVAKQVSRIERELERTESAVDRKRLERAKQDLERVLRRQGRLPARDTATAAQLTSMAEAFEELYHRIVTDPGSTAVTDYLREATDRLAIEEELALDVESELEDVAKKARARAANAVKTR
jgi:hypothetical protein